MTFLKARIKKWNAVYMSGKGTDMTIETQELSIQPKSSTPSYNPQGFRNLAVDPGCFQQALSPVIERSEPKFLERGSSDLRLSLSNAYAYRKEWLNSRGQPGGLITPVSFFGSLTERSFNDEQRDKWKKYINEGDIPRGDAVRATSFLITSRLSHHPNSGLPLRVAEVLIPDLNVGEQLLFRQPAVVIYKMTLSHPLS